MGDPFDKETQIIQKRPMFLDRVFQTQGAEEGEAIKKYYAPFELKTRVFACRACPLNHYQKTVPFCNFQAHLMVITDKPSSLSSETQDGRFLLKNLKQSRFLDDVYLTSVVKCEASVDVEKCFHFLLDEMIIVHPDVAVALGPTVGRPFFNQLNSFYPGAGITLANGIDLLVGYSLSEIRNNNESLLNDYFSVARSRIKLHREVQIHV
jgi:uracil-DNA glycosylase